MLFKKMTFRLFSFQSFCRWAYLINVVQENDF
jgi:hypothetical protein